jgi:hypothetical protein
METTGRMEETLSPSQDTRGWRPNGLLQHLSNILKTLWQFGSKLSGSLGTAGIAVARRVNPTASRLLEASAGAAGFALQLLKDTLKSIWKLSADISKNALIHFEQMPIKNWATLEHFSLLFIVCVFTFVVALGWEADNPSWPLASMSTTYGILLLNILTIFTNLGFGQLTDTAWEKLAWGPILRRSGNFLTFLTLTSGIRAWIEVLRRKVGGQSGEQGTESNQAHDRLWWSPRLWSISRQVHFNEITNAGPNLRKIVLLGSRAIARSHHHG